MQISFRKQQIPWVMAGGRAVLGPLMVVGQVCGWNGSAMAAMIVAALLSDIFDGVLARRWNCDTAAVRLFDSMGDTVFYLGVAVALWMGHHNVLRTHAWLLGGLLSLEAARFAFDFAKFGKPASYHSYLAKTWGLVMAIAVTVAFATGRGEWLITAALSLGIACNVEGLAMSVTLRKWRRDVKTLSAALRIRLMEQAWCAPGAVGYAQRREVVSRKPATGSPASIESGFANTSGAMPGR
jgi:phosphatidylglycerophosphate synthase